MQPESSSASQKIYRILWKPYDYYRIQKNTPLVPILSQIQTISTTHFLKIHFNIIPNLRLGLPNGLPRSYLPHQNPARTSSVSHTCRLSCVSPSLWFYHLSDIWSAVQTIRLLAVQTQNTLRWELRTLTNVEQPRLLQQCAYCGGDFRCSVLTHVLCYF